MAKTVTTHFLLDAKSKGERISLVTAYDYPTALACEEGGADILLVGDSLGMVVQGHDTTLPVTLQDILYHTRMVARAAKRAMVLADMPFLTYQVSTEEAVRNAGRLLAEGGAQTVKLEGGREVVQTVQRMVQSGIPVMGHLGLTPQSVHALGGYRVQGRTREAAAALLLDALALEDAGAFAVVLELVPAEVAAEVSRHLRIPTIGIGSGAGCDGQAQVLPDMIGLYAGGPRHARRYAEVGRSIRDAVAAYRSDVLAGTFPGPDHAPSLGDEAEDMLEAMRQAGADIGR